MVYSLEPPIRKTIPQDGRHGRLFAFGTGFSGQMTKAIVGLRPAFSAHVRWGEHGAPVRFPPALVTTQAPARLGRFPDKLGIG
jgi:hypothetical protein